MWEVIVVSRAGLLKPWEGIVLTMPVSREEAVSDAVDEGNWSRPGGHMLLADKSIPPWDHPREVLGQ